MKKIEYALLRAFALSWWSLRMNGRIQGLAKWIDEKHRQGYHRAYAAMAIVDPERYEREIGGRARKASGQPNLRLV